MGRGALADIHLAPKSLEQRVLYSLHLGLEQTRHEKSRTTRFIPRRAGDDDSPDSETAAAAWLCPGAAHQADLERSAADRRRVALPGSPTPAQGRLGEGRLGHLLHQSPGPDLRLDSQGREAPGTPGVEFRKNAGRNYQSSRAGGIAPQLSRDRQEALPRSSNQAALVV